MSSNGKKTLVSLTQDFIALLITANGQELDLTQIGSMLNVSKRRLYDVTNVLDGIGVIERTGKSRIRWIGSKASSDETYTEDVLQQRLNNIDKMTIFVDKLLAELEESEEFQSYAWVSENDIKKLGNGEDFSFFALKGSKDLTIQINDTDEVHNLTCKAETGAVDFTQIVH